MLSVPNAVKAIKSSLIFRPSEQQILPHTDGRTVCGNKHRIAGEIGSYNNLNVETETAGYDC
jgi:hypothetical protein